MSGHYSMYELESHVTSTEDDNAKFTVRRNGKVFHVRVSPAQFVNSPVTTEKYLSYLEVLRSGEEVVGDILPDVIEWILRPFEPLFAELAPSPTSPGHALDIEVTLRDYLFPEFFILDLHVEKEDLQPRRVKVAKSPYRPSTVLLDDDFLDDVEKWTSLYDPANIVLSFENPEDALFKRPRRVLIDGERVGCFFKPCYSTIQTLNELKAYKKIAAENLASQPYISRLHGVVIDDDGFVVGLLLTYIEHGGRTLAARVDPDHPPESTRRRWAGQLDAALTELHKARVVWGDVKAENVLVDQEENAWIIDFGGGYTGGWMERRAAETVEGDLAGMVKLKEFIFQDEAQDRWWSR